MQGALRKLTFTSKHLFKPSLSFCPAKRLSYTQDTTGLDEEQAQIYQTALDFAKENLAPYAAEWDKKEYFPIETMRKAAELGFGAIYASPEYGGCGMGRLEASLIFEALATGDVSVTGFMTVHNMCTWLIDEFGTEEQKKRWMPSLVPMEKLISICLTEPNSGSDSAAMQTFAREEGDYYILNGSKSFISGATASDLYTVFCKTGANERSCLIVEKGTPGFTFGKLEQKLGWRNQPTAMLLFEDCKVPKANLLGDRGTGFKKAMVGLEGGRINIASCSLGGASFCLETAQEYVKSRKQFGKPLSDFQNIQFKLADMATDLVASRLMVRTAAKMIDENHPDKSMYSAMAKKFATDKCSDIVNYTLQMHGGYGYLMDYPIERCLRDLRVHQILEGTNEVMQLIVSRRLLKD